MATELHRNSSLKLNSSEESLKFTSLRIEQGLTSLSRKWDSFLKEIKTITASKLEDKITILGMLSQKIEQLTNQDFEEVTGSNKSWQHFCDELWPSFTDQFESSIKSITESICEIKGKCEVYDKMLIQKNALEKEYKSVKKSYQRLKDLDQVIGKNALKNYILSEMEKSLLAQANIELTNLCEGRYLLKLEKATHGSEYYIQDFWNGGHQRKVSTLSGGETFMVSLALSLALAELSRGQTVIDAFFIDEGFGTLDDDSINEVLEVLNKIKNTGKQIGIISHVKKLTDQIPLNIDIKKVPSGPSEITAKFN
jgi:DNA repair exonuclease SbcCD ATPase subunit